MYLNFGKRQWLTITVPSVQAAPRMNFKIQIWNLPKGSTLQTHQDFCSSYLDTCILYATYE
jgi:hypothetical protein